MKRHYDQVVPMRIPAEILAEIDDAEIRRERWAKATHQPWWWRVRWGRSDFILSAIREKLAKQKRGRRRRSLAAVSVQPS